MRAVVARILASADDEPKKAKGNHKFLTFRDTVMPLVKHYLKDNGHEADYTDDDQDSLMVNTDLNEVRDTFASHKVESLNEREVLGGVFTQGLAIDFEFKHGTVTAIQISGSRTYLCLNPK